MSSLASASLDRHIILWDLHTGTAIQQLEGHSRGVSSLCFLNDKKTLVSTGVDQSLRVWDLTSGELIRSLNNHTLPVHDLALRPDVSGLSMIVSAGDDRTVRFWQPTIGRMVKFARLKEAPLNNATPLLMPFQRQYLTLLLPLLQVPLRLRLHLAPPRLPI